MKCSFLSLSGEHCTVIVGLTVPDGIGVRLGCSVSLGSTIVPVAVGPRVGVLDGAMVGTLVGTPVGVLLGSGVGVLVGTPVGVLLGMEVGVLVSVRVGVLVGVRVGVLVGTVVGILVGTRVGVLVRTVVEVLVGVAVFAAGWSLGSPGKVSARSSWILLKPSPSESMFSMATSAAALRPLFRNADPYGFRLGIAFGTWHRLHVSMRVPMINGY